MESLVLKVVAFLFLAFVAVVMLVATTELLSPRLNELKDSYRLARNRTNR